MDMVERCHENYPLKIVLLTNLHSISIYIIGAYLICALGVIYAILYLFYCIFLEFRLLKSRCVCCYYYGRVCAFGKGFLSSLLFKKGPSNKFSLNKVTWKEMIPDMMVFVAPLIGGMISLIINFRILSLSLIIILVILALPGNAFIRGITCKTCKQGQLGCPALEFFH